MYQAAMTAAQQAAASCSPLLCIAKPDLSDPLLILHDLAALARLRMEGAKTAIAHFKSTGMPWLQMRASDFALLGHLHCYAWS